MRAYPQSLLYQLVGQTLTILSSNQTGKVGKVETTHDSKCVIISLHVHEWSPLSYKPTTKICKIKLSLTTLLKDVKLHSLCKK
nr:MAG TPA: hypothetical protein [Caudoviricetes sp.]